MTERLRELAEKVDGGNFLPHLRQSQCIDAAEVLSRAVLAALDANCACSEITVTSEDPEMSDKMEVLARHAMNGVCKGARRAVMHLAAFPEGED